MTNHDARIVTQVVLILVTALLLGYNTAIWWMFGREATISSVLHEVVERWPLFLLLVGILIGHIWAIK